MTSRRAALRNMSLGLACLARPSVSRAQEPGRTYRLAGIHNTPRDAPQHAALFAEVARAGFTADQNLKIDGFGLRTERFADFAREMVQARVDVLSCAGDAAIRAAQKATGSIPIVAITDDMVEAGLVRSLATPGGNTTGVSLLSHQLDGKRQEILIELVPGLRRIGVLSDPNTTSPRQLQVLQDAARGRGVTLSLHSITSPEEIVPGIDAAKHAGSAALNVLASPLLVNGRRLIFERAAALRLPAIYQWPEMAAEGALAAYGPRLMDVFRDLFAQQLIKVLRGARPADVPIVQLTKFELALNEKTAKALGLGIPRSIRLRADQIIQ